MIDYAKNLQRREQYGAVRVQNGIGLAVTWSVRIAGEQVAELSTDELDELAQGLAFRLSGHTVVATPAGIEVEVGENAAVHLCYADEHETFAKGVATAAAQHGVTV